MNESTIFIVILIGLAAMGSYTAFKLKMKNRDLLEAMAALKKGESPPPGPAQSRELNKSLDARLDRFSLDLFKVMKIADLEDRLIAEILDMLGLEDGVHILEIDDRLNLYRCTGGNAALHETALRNFDETASIGQIVEFNLGCLIKIGEFNGRIILLCVEGKTDRNMILEEKTCLQIISRYVSVLYENLYTLEDVAKELERSSQDKSTPRWILKLLFYLSEKERERLSADLHDSVLQNQILWYRKLQSLRSDLNVNGPAARELVKIEEGMLDVIRQIRVTCYHLCPPYLKEAGLVKALEILIGEAESEADFEIEFDSSGLGHDLSEEQTTAIYRVTQELLANARKHSRAAKVEISISSIDGNIYFSYSDNGVGMEVQKLEYSFEHLGLSGMKKRIDSLDGDMELYSSPGKGVSLLFSIPADVNEMKKSKLFGVFE